MALKQFLVNIPNGTNRTISVPDRCSLRYAAKLFVTRYSIQPGDEFKIKERGVGDWVLYVRTSNGIRQLG